MLHSSQRDNKLSQRADSQNMQFKEPFENPVFQGVLLCCSKSSCQHQKNTLIPPCGRLFICLQCSTLVRNIYGLKDSKSSKKDIKKIHNYAIIISAIAT